MRRTVTVNGYDYDLPLSREASFEMPDEDMIAIAVDGFRRLRGNTALVPSPDEMTARIMADTGVNFGAAMLVAMTDTAEKLFPPHAA